MRKWKNRLPQGYITFAVALSTYNLANFFRLGFGRLQQIELGYGAAPAPPHLPDMMLPEKMLG